MNPVPPILITSRDQAEDLLLSRSMPLRYVISIGDEEDDAPPLDLHAGPSLRMVFYDINGDDILGWAGMGQDDARRLVEFCALIAKDPGPTLVHCAAGISRSSAAALVLLATLLGPGQEAAAVEALIQAVIQTRSRGYRDTFLVLPNRRVTALCDSLLGREGRLLAERDKLVVGFTGA